MDGKTDVLEEPHVDIEFIVTLNPIKVSAVWEWGEDNDNSGSGLTPAVATAIIDWLRELLCREEGKCTG